MKKFTTFCSSHLLLLMLGLALAFQASAYDFKVNGSSSNKLQVTESNYSTLQLRSSLSAFKTFGVKTPEGKFSELQVAGYTPSTTVGAPKLPVMRKMIEVPVSANPVVEIINYTVNEYDLAQFGITDPIIPAQAPQSKSLDFVEELAYNKALYATDAFYSQELVTVDVLGTMRGTQLGRINVAPVSYNPVTNKIRVYENLEFAIHFEGADVVRTIQMKQKGYSPYFGHMSKTLLNYQSLEMRENFKRYPIKYVIIADPMFEDQLQPFIEWKTRKGFTVVEAYTDDANVGNTTTSIKSYLKDLYDAGTAEDPAPSFVLFVGDVQQIPSYSGTTGSHVSDLYYVEYTNDNFPEVYYGRFSAQNTAQLQPQIDKTLQYEQYTMPDPSYLEDVCLVAGMDGGHGNDWGNGQINYGTENYFNAAHGLNTMVYLYPESGSHAADIHQHVSDGVSYTNYSAHCGPSGWSDPSFTVNDVANLTNQDKYGFMVGNCCLSNKFDDNNCFGEAILRAENKGCIGYIGGTNSTYWDEDYYWGVGVGTISEDPPSYEETTLGVYDRVFHDHGEAFEEWYTCAYEICFAGNLAVTESGSSRIKYYWEIYSVSGDPSLMPYLGVPSETTADYAGLMPLGSTSFEVNTQPYAYIAIVKDGVLYGSALSDENGNAEVTLTPIPVPGQAEIVITRQNGQPFFGEVTVASPDGAYLLLDEFELTDAAGNNNGQADYNEDIKLNITLENVGTETANNVTAVISTSDDNITITDDTQDWTAIENGQTASQDDAFAFTVNNLIEDNHLLTLQMVMTDELDSTWNAEIKINLHAPAFAAGEIVYDDATGGNNNGRLDPDETVIVRITAINEGSCDAPATTAVLSSSSPYITVTAANADLNTLGAGASAEAEFTIETSSDAPAGVAADLIFHMESDPYTLDYTYLTTVGLLVEDWETGDFNKFEWSFAGDADWALTDVAPYEGVYSAKSGSIADNQSSELILDYTLANDDVVSFYVKVSSESGYDKLKFFVDNTASGEWSGNQNWVRAEVPVAAGQHTFKWEYAKDYSSNSGQDCAWVDFIVLPPIVTTTAFAGIDDDNCNLTPYQCNGSATVYNSVEWSTSGTGTFSDASILNPIYTPTQADYDNETITLTLTVHGDDIDVSDEMTLTFHNCASYEELVSTIDVNLYPNPSNGAFNIELKSGTEDHVSLQVVNTMGKMVYNESDILLSAAFNKTIDLGHLAEGIYYLYVEGSETRIVKKIIINK